MAQVHVSRVYEDPGRSGGSQRVLVDRLWPRGKRKEDLDIDEWAKDAAPSTELRRWYGHDPERFVEFARRYRAELAEEPAASVVADLRDRARRERLVLLTATRDVERSGAEVLRRVLAGEDVQALSAPGGAAGGGAVPASAPRQPAMSAARRRLGSNRTLPDLGGRSR